ncbi:MAG TPA: hypothetical protein VN515_00780 [Terriglobales bacterium]|nr:hypothetical protein [Terriglobales bacterium]
MKILLSYWRPILAALLVAGLAGWGYNRLQDYGARQFEAGRQQVLAADAVAAQAAQTQATQRAADAAAAGVDLHIALDTQLPKIEATTNDAAEKVRTIYLAQPAADRAVCQRPAGVQEELDAARRRANAAARGDL